MNSLVPRTAHRRIGAIVVLGFLAACGGDEDGEGGGDAADATAADTQGAGPDLGDAGPVTGDWLTVGVDTTWQWQLQGTVNTSYDVDLYDVDLFDTSAQAIAALQGAGRRVLCYFSAGSSEDWRPDFADFPASAIGEPLDDWEGERWVDIRSPAIVAIMLERLDMAKAKGCDGVEPDNVTAWDADSGFPIGPADQIVFNRRLADEAHLRGLAIALKNDGDQVPELVAWFDLSVNEECHFYDECEQLQPFIDAGKPVLNAEYVSTKAKAESLAKTLCPKAQARQTRTLILPLELDDSFRVSCD